ncbi:MAG TPA: nucleotide exchange factor GrpE [bacterium]|nr:nucleotide exchange factor GrpE [bacterium]
MDKRKKRKVEIPVEETRDVDEPAARAVELAEKLAAAEEAAAAAQEELLRRVADLENARKRLARESERACAMASQYIIEKLLPVLDDLTRAIDAADTDEAVPQHHVDAIRMLDRKIYDVLRGEGLEVISPGRGDPFDPEVHEAVLATCDAELPPNVVANVFDRGYKFKGMLLKPARVEVCVPREGEPGAAPTPPGNGGAAPA